MIMRDEGGQGMVFDRQEINAVYSTFESRDVMRCLCSLFRY